MGVLQRIGSGEFEGAVESTEAPFEVLKRLLADTSDFTPCGGYSLDGFGAWVLRPREGVEDRAICVVKIRLQFATFRDEPEPMRVGLKNSKAVIISEGKDPELMIGAYLPRNKSKDRTFSGV